jgi:hypothetical protein
MTFANPNQVLKYDYGLNPGENEKCAWVQPIFRS